MKKIFRRITAGALLAAIMTLLLAGCGSDAKDAASANSLTYWRELPSATSAVATSLNETPFAKKLQEATGITVNYTHPPQGQASEKFNIMIASKNLPDIIEYAWPQYPGGPGKAIKDGKIIRLNEYIEKYAPNLMTYLNENEDIKKLCTTDEGDIFAFPFIRGTDALCITEGLVLRKDWLDELNLEVPETIDEWENVLTAFKTAKNIESPLDISTYPFTVGAFSGAYGALIGFFVEDGQVKYGPNEAGYKDFLAKMNDWYQKGLVSPDIASLPGDVITSDLLSDKTGAVFGAIGGGIGTWMSSKPNDTFDLVGAKYPVLNKGDLPKFHSHQLACPYNFAAITTSCKNPELAAEFLAYGYSDEGQMLYNFGIEGESYEMIDGYPTYTDNIKNNQEGYSMANMLGQYCLSFDQGPFIQRQEYYEQYAGMPQQQAAWQQFAIGDGINRTVPYIYFDEQENQEIAKKQTAISTFVVESLCKYIMGIEPMENFDEYKAELEALGINEVLEAKQNAYEKYLNR